MYTANCQREIEAAAASVIAVKTTAAAAPLNRTHNVRHTTHTCNFFPAHLKKRTHHCTTNRTNSLTHGKMKSIAIQQNSSSSSDNSSSNIPPLLFSLRECDTEKAEKHTTHTPPPPTARLPIYCLLTHTHMYYTYCVYSIRIKRNILLPPQQQQQPTIHTATESRSSSNTFCERNV